MGRGGGVPRGGGRHSAARIAFASTVRGYEGTGRGFVLRFLEWLGQLPRPLEILRLEQPIRWDAGDPLERLVFDALALDAEPPGEAFIAAREPVDAERLRHIALDRDALARDERLLRDLFGLLVQAHYRTVPSDLQRLLDAPNLGAQVLLLDGRVVAATLLAQEGGLAADICQRMARGGLRIRGHALPDTLICHAGQRAAGELSMVRSVRIATHPALRRRGLARRLVAQVHGTCDCDLFGTIFGATPQLLRFRRALGYQLVRLGSSLGARSGEPAAVMLRPVSAAAQALVARLRGRLARELPLQLELLRAEAELDPALVRELAADLPPALPLGERERQGIVDDYLFGPCHYEAAAFALERTVEVLSAGLDELDPLSVALIRARVLRRRGWARVAREAGLPSVHAAQRALKRALRALVAGHQKTTTRRPG